MATDEPAPPPVTPSSSSSQSSDPSLEGYPTAQDPNTPGACVRVSYLGLLEGVATYVPKDTLKKEARGRTAHDFAAEFGGEVDEAMKSRSDAVRENGGGADVRRKNKVAIAWLGVENLIFCS